MNVKSEPIPVKRAIKKLGQDLRDARKRRRLPMRLIAARANISRTTLTKIENGDSGVSLGAYAKIFFVLSMIERVSDLADPRFDKLGLGLDTENLPKRIRFPKKEIG